MKNILFKSLALLTINVFCLNTYSKDNINKLNIPDSILKIIADSLPNYYIPNDNQFLVEWKEYDNLKRPMYAVSDFNGDSIIDYAFVLSSKCKNSVSIFVFVSKSRNRYRIINLREFNTTPKLIDIFINVEKRGWWESTSEKKHIKHDGLNVIWASASVSYSYYWKGNSFQKFFYD